MVRNNGLTLTEMQFAILSLMRSGVQFIILLEWWAPWSAGDERPESEKTFSSFYV
jgi:hypothetical protein